MKTAHIYITENRREKSHRIPIIDAMPVPGTKYLDTNARVITVELLNAYVESDEEAIMNGSVYKTVLERDDGSVFEEIVLVPADMTMSVNEFITNLMDSDWEGIDHMTVEDAAETLRVMRYNDYKNEIPADLTAEELARRWNEIKGA